MAFSILLLFGVAIWLCYEYLTDASYHARKADQRKIERRHKDYEKKYQALIDDGWTVLESYAYNPREEEIMSKLFKEDADTIRRTGLQSPPLKHLIPFLCNNGLFLHINRIEFSLINYNEKVISHNDLSYPWVFPNHERDLRFYNWLKYAYDLYLMSHRDFIQHAGKILSKNDLIWRKNAIISIVGDLPDPEYPDNDYRQVAYCGQLSEGRNANGEWVVFAREAIDPLFCCQLNCNGEIIQEYEDELSDFLNGVDRTYENEISDEEIRLYYEEFSHGGYPILCYDKELLRGNIIPSYVNEEIIQMLLPGFNDKRFFTGLSPVKTNLQTLPEWKFLTQFDSLEETLSVIDFSADSHWEKDDSTGEFVLYTKAYAVFRKYGKIGSDDMITKKVCVIAKSAEAFKENLS